MHAPAQHYSSGSRITKIAIVAVLHIGLVAGVMNSTVLVNAFPPATPFGYVPPLPPVAPPRLLELPVTPNSAPLPVITVPTPVIETNMFEPTITVTHSETVLEPPVTTGPVAGDAGGMAGGTAARVEPRPERVYNAALANADACALPSYPARSIREGNTGTVTLALLIGPDGKVGASRVQRSSGHPELDRAAVAALKLCTFKPATTNGVAESAWGQIAYVWTLD